MKFCFHILFFLIPILSFGQLDYVINVDPQIGDVTEYAVEQSIGHIDFKEDYFGKLQWDFSNLDDPDFVEKVFVLSIDDSIYKDDFLDADFRVVKESGSERFFKKMESSHSNVNTQIMEIGVAGYPTYSLGAEISVPFQGDVTNSHSPMRDGQLFSENYSFQESLSISVFRKDAPQIHQILAKNGIDSIKISTSVIAEYDTDAYGSLKLPSRTYDEVVRVTIKEEYTTILEVRYGLTGVWSYFSLGELPKEIANMFGNRKLKRYFFYADGYNMPIVQVEIPEINFIPYTSHRILYLAEASVWTSTNDLDGQAVIDAYPNPTFGDITFQREDTSSASKIELYNIIGKKVDAFYLAPGINSVNANLSHLQKGTYIYSLIDDKGRKLITKRLILLNP